MKVIGWSVLLATCVPLLIALFSRKKAPSTSHGSAIWGGMKVLKRAGLLSGKGIVLCQTNDARFTPGARPGDWRMDRPGQLITHDGPEHVIAFAPTRSGKGIGTVIPTLLNWKASALVYDIKKELWTRTAGWRRQFSRCWRFEPTAADSVRFNPLLEVRRGDSEVRDVQNIADILVDPDGSSRRSAITGRRRLTRCSRPRFSTSSTPRRTSRSPGSPGSYQIRKCRSMRPSKGCSQPDISQAGRTLSWSSARGKCSTNPKMSWRASSRPQKPV